MLTHWHTKFKKNENVKHKTSFKKIKLQNQIKKEIYKINVTVKMLNECL